MERRPSHSSRFETVTFKLEEDTSVRTARLDGSLLALWFLRPWTEIAPSHYGSDRSVFWLVRNPSVSEGEVCSLPRLLFPTEHCQYTLDYET